MNVNLPEIPPDLISLYTVSTAEHSSLYSGGNDNWMVMSLEGYEIGFNIDQNKLYFSVICEEDTNGKLDFERLDFDNTRYNFYLLHKTIIGFIKDDDSSFEDTKFSVQLPNNYHLEQDVEAALVWNALPKIDEKFVPSFIKKFRFSGAADKFKMHGESSLVLTSKEFTDALLEDRIIYDVKLKEYLYS